ncbi:Uncharacterised protein [Escherichia coli]|nr:hypothetical protein BvCmsC8A_00715 [Escherichia coli]CTY82411.1 Uncharacterised protein [Escherichia coli]
MFEALTSIPNASVSMGVRLHISRAGRKTSHACFSVVAPEYTSAPNSLSQAKQYRATPAEIADLPFLRGISVYTSRKRRSREPLLTQPNAQQITKSCHGSSVMGIRLNAHSPLVCGNS